MSTKQHGYDPPGCLCSRSWEIIFGDKGRFVNGIKELNEPEHCDHLLYTTAAAQHLMYRFDSAGKVNGKYCKYSKNFVMKFQRKHWTHLVADGRTKAQDWKQLIDDFGDPDTEDTGGVVEGIYGGAPSPEI